MAVDDVALALIKLHEESIREAVRSGDFSALGALTDEERRLIANAAMDEPEVSGFLADSAGAFRYLATNRSQLSTGARSELTQFFQSRYGRYWTIPLMN